MLGGYNCVGRLTSFSKLYDGLIPHQGLRINATIYKIDRWNSESIFCSIDDSSFNFNGGNNLNFNEDLCGQQ